MELGEAKESVAKNISPRSAPAENAGYRFRKPQASDALSVNRLIADSPPLDPNSLYCNLLQCSHFADTCVVVESEQRLLAFMSAYIKPAEPEVLFIWQMVVSNECRGQGVANRMLVDLLARPTLAPIEFIETTVTPGNTASAKVFQRFAEHYDAPLVTQTLFQREQHFGGQHDDEILFRIGPLVGSSRPLS